MAKLSEKVQAEYEQIENLLKEMPASEKLPYLSFLELAGVATLLHNFYNGVENILKQCLYEENIPVPAGSSSHKDLLITSVQHGILSQETILRLGEYLAFRHFFVHAYALDLYADKMESLVENINAVFGVFQKEINAFLEKHS
jgi:hypothetical protein